LSKVKAVFLDRDGIINIDNGYVYRQNDFIFNQEIFEVLKYLQKKDFCFFIVTNQSGIGRGIYSEQDFIKLNNWMINEFLRNKIKISSVKFCPHNPNTDCDCRKPKTGMFKEIENNNNLDLNNSWMIGDKESDILFAINSGIKNTIFLRNDNYYLNSTVPDFTIDSIIEIKEII
jgi:D-glycero-D-manno-heptose 1,7-bisphosphate phosphatase